MSLDWHVDAEPAFVRSGGRVKNLVDRHVVGVGALAGLIAVLVVVGLGMVLPGVTLIECHGPTSQ